MSKRDPWWDRLNRVLFPYIGPPQLGPGPGGERMPDESVIARCPLCGQPMSLHEIERTADWSTPTRLHCPEQSVSNPEQTPHAA